MYMHLCFKDCSEKYVLGIHIDFKRAFDYYSWNSILARVGDVNRMKALGKLFLSEASSCWTTASCSQV